MLQSARPKGRMNNLRPTVRSVEERGASTFRDVTYPAFYPTVLMVGVYVAKRDELIGFIDGCKERCSVEKTIITMVVANVDIVRMGKSLESFYNLNRGSSCHLHYEVNIC